MPGLAEWGRVREWRVAQLEKLSNVEVFRESELDSEQILEFGADCVALATGATWRRDGVGRSHELPVEGWESAHVLTPDDILGGVTPEGPVLVFDDDHYYIGGIVAEALRRAGCEVRLITPAGYVSAWTRNTDEQPRIQARLLELGVVVETGALLESIAVDKVIVACAYTGRTREVEAASVVLATSRAPRDALYHELCEQIEITRIGDCNAPGTIATAVHSGHAYARGMDEAPAGDVPFRREHALVPPTDG
jgi:dimethylamine/trimethylamine dehydrogenase